MKRIYILIVMCVSIIFETNGQLTWRQVDDFPGGNINRTISFEYDGAVYVGTGAGDSTIRQEIWAFDLESETWNRKADFPGAPRVNAFAFTAGDFAYIGNGFDNPFTLDDFWRYNPREDSWARLSDFPGGGRNFAFTISAGDKAYLVAGGGSFYYNDFWEFDSKTESWTRLPDFPGIPRWRMYGWLLDQKIYIGGGEMYDFNEGLFKDYSDFYAYDLLTGEWSQKTACPTQKPVGGFSFTKDGKGYYLEGSTAGSGVGIGEFGKNMFVYDPESDTWEEGVDFPGEPRIFGFVSPLEDKILLGGGRNHQLEKRYNDAYLLEVESPSSLDEITNLEISIYPNPAEGSKLSITGAVIGEKEVVFTIYSPNGRLLNQIRHHNNNLAQIDIDTLPSGAYLLEVFIPSTGEKTFKRFSKN